MLLDIEEKEDSEDFWHDALTSKESTEWSDVAMGGKTLHTVTLT